MREYTASAAQEHFADLLQAVEQGDEVAVTRHGKVIAKITRIAESDIPHPGWAVEEGWSITMSEDFNTIPEGVGEHK